VCLELDLAQDADLQVHETVAQYAQQLREDATSRPLPEDLIQQLLADPRFNIGLEKRPPASTGNPGSPDGLPALFGLSQHPKKHDPAPAAAASPQPAGPSDGGMPAEGGGAPHMDAATADRVQKFGEAAYRHKEIIDQHGSITRTASLAIRREMYGMGPGVRRTATLFGREDS
jgi:hypothetical protein